MRLLVFRIYATHPRYPRSSKRQLEHPPLALVCLPRGAGAGEQCCAGKDTADAVCGRYQSDGSDFDLNRVDTCQFSAGRTVILRRESASSTVTPQAACVRLARFGRQCNMSDEEYCRSQLGRRR